MLGADNDEGEVISSVACSHTERHSHRKAAIGSILVTRRAGT